MSDDAEIIESESLRPDRRANRAGCTIIAHHTRESFMQASGRPAVRCMTCPGYADAPDHVGGCPRYERIPAAEARRAMAAIWNKPE